MEDLLRRFEEPDAKNRWDSPLFELPMGPQESARALPLGHKDPWGDSHPGEVVAAAGTEGPEGLGGPEGPGEAGGPGEPEAVGRGREHGEAWAGQEAGEGAGQVEKRGQPDDQSGALGSSPQDSGEA